MSRSRKSFEVRDRKSLECLKATVARNVNVNVLLVTSQVEMRNILMETGGSVALMLKQEKA